MHMRWKALGIAIAVVGVAIVSIADYLSFDPKCGSVYRDEISREQNSTDDEK